MSSMTIKAVWPGERVENIVSYKNAHGGAMRIWCELGERYMGNRHVVVFDDKKFWPLYKDTRLPLHQRTVLTMTYDDALVYKKDYARMAADLRLYLADFKDWNGVTHLEAIAGVLESDPDCPAIGFYWTSVSGDPFCAGYDDDDNPRELDWTKFWDVFAVETNKE